VGDGDMVGKDDHGVDDQDIVVPDSDQKPDTCGNGEVDLGEVCDGGLKNCTEIDPMKYKAGKAACLDSCLGWDTVTCEEYEYDCGDGDVDFPEVCEIGELTDCVEIDPGKYKAGKAYCLDTCLGYDTATCEEITEDDDIMPDFDMPSDDDTTDDWIPDTVDTDHFDDDVVPDVDTTCTHTCDTLNEAYCNGALVMQCQIGVDGCRHWAEEVDCSDTGRLCNDNNEVGDGGTSNARTALTKVNHFQCTATRDLGSFEMYVAPSLVGQSLVWVVYEATTETGTYSLIAQKTTTATATTAAWYSSGAMTRTDVGHVGETITLTSGRFYAIGLAWNESLTSYYWSPGFLQPFETEYTMFGATLGGTANDATYPPLASFSGGPANDSTYWMRVHVLNTDPDLCVCQNECDAAGIQQCDVDAVEECVADAYGCLSWVLQEDCVLDWEPDRVCTEAGDVATCEEEATEIIDTIGSAESPFSGISRMRGNFYSCDTDRTLTEIEQYLSYSGTATIYFEVYEATTQLGTYYPVQSISRSISMSGYAFYSSGAVSIPLISGRYYYIGARWGSSYTVGYYNNYTTTFYDTEFGQWQTGMTYDDITTAPSSFVYDDHDSPNYAYYQRLTTQ